MAVHAGDIAPGEFFMAIDGQLRKVARLATDPNGCMRVWYQSKPVTLPAQPLLFAHGRADAPLLATFAEQCVGRISPRQLQELRDSGILLAHE